MIISFHPCFNANKNIICAGREADAYDLSAIRSAKVVILSQGCRKSLYDMARIYCPNVFPDYFMRFKYSDKIGQIYLFRETETPHPETLCYRSVDNYCEELKSIPFDFPFVFKFAWGGEGETVFLVHSEDELQDMLQKAKRFEKTGQSGFLIQEYIWSNHRAMRIVVIGGYVVSYWRIQKNPENFRANCSQGAVIDTESDPDLQAEAIYNVKEFCAKTKINLAGLDILFSREKKLLFLEINYFFGREGLGGSERYYRLLQKEIRKWIRTLNL